MSRAAQPTPERLRAAIDRGATKDKVAFPDPASAPLGTDDEAAGRPASVVRVEMAERQERKQPTQPVEEGSEPTEGAGLAAGTISLVFAVTALGIVGLLGALIWTWFNP